MHTKGISTYLLIFFQIHACFLYVSLKCDYYINIIKRYKMEDKTYMIFWVSKCVCLKNILRLNFSTKRIINIVCPWFKIDTQSI